MEISEIKASLNILTLNHYGKQPDKNNRLHCPFHDDKTPSMQVYPKTNSYYCFGCGAKGDVIQFIEDYEKIEKSAAINKAKEFIDPNHKTVSNMFKQSGTTSVNNQEKTAVLTKAYNYFKKVTQTKQLKDYLQSRNLQQIETGFNNGQLHHRQSKELVESYAKYGLLLKGKTNGIYTAWAKHCIIFALKDNQNNISGLYGRSLLAEGESKHFYLKDRAGLYPSYPKEETKKIIIAESIIDTASLMQIEEITKDYSLLASYGTNGIRAEHKKALKELESLNEIILFFDGDKAGNDAVEKYSKELHELLPHITISKIETPENEDVNSLSVAHEPEIFTHLIKERKNLFLLTKALSKATTQVKEKVNDQASEPTPSALERKNQALLTVPTLNI